MKDYPSIVHILNVALEAQEEALNRFTQIKHLINEMQISELERMFNFHPRRFIYEKFLSAYPKQGRMVFCVGRHGQSDGDVKNNPAFNSYQEAYDHIVGIKPLDSITVLQHQDTSLFAEEFPIPRYLRKDGKVNPPETVHLV